MKQIILSAIALLLCFSLCRAQTTSKDINIQKQQLSLSDLITLTKSKSLESARTFMSAKGWRKLPFEIDRKDDNGKTDYKGKLPVGFLRDDLEFFEHLPHDYKKLIWGVAYAEKSHNGSVYEYSETYCYVYFSATETSAVAFGNPITNKAYSESLLKQLANAGFKATQGGDYRNDTYELRINRGNQYFFYNHREFEANKVKRKATADRQGQEQWEKIQEKIKDETLSDLLPHAYALRKQGVFPHESLLDLDVLAYFSEDIPEDKINSELKIANFKKSEEYAAKLNSMRKWRQEVFSSVYYIIDDDSDYNNNHYFSSSLYGKTEYKYKYSMAEHGFKIHLLDWSNRCVSKAIGISSFDALKSRYLIANTLPVRKDKNTRDSEYFLAAMDETTALEIENNSEDMQTYLFFMLNGKYDNNGICGQMLYTDKVRIVIANKKTGKIYYDRSFPENSIKMSKHEMSDEQYNEWLTTKERLEAEIKKAKPITKIELQSDKTIFHIKRTPANNNIYIFTENDVHILDRDTQKKYKLLNYKKESSDLVLTFEALPETTNTIDIIEKEDPYPYANPFSYLNTYSVSITAEQEARKAAILVEEKRKLAEEKRKEEARLADRKRRLKIIAALESNMVLVQVGSGVITVGATSTRRTNERGEWIGGYNYNSTDISSVMSASDFYMGKYEITQAEWEAITVSDLKQHCEKKSRCTLRNLGDNVPMYNVSDKEVLEFIKDLNEITGKNYRLPTESEWEFTYRGGNLSKNYKYSGSNDKHEAGWVDIDDTNDAPFAVGTKIPNELGIYDMHGNVAELCISENYPGISENYRSRGDGWCLRCQHAERNTWRGFRLACDADISDETKPEFPGGHRAMWDFFKKNIQYPLKSYEKNIFGKITVQFAVDTDGSVKEVKFLESFDSKCKDEVLRVITAMPKWKPAMQDGKPVKAYYTLPISFKK